jgi:prepilin-type N-terminal cleavage/methylation domain-containing protein
VHVVLKQGRKEGGTNMNARKAAFTLIELLVVIVIIGILAALLFSGINAAIRLARRTQAKSEVQLLAAAMDAYYAEYHRWPPTTVTTVPDPELTEVRINGDVAKMLLGEDFSNPKKIGFMQFRQFANGDQTKPVNPWWKAGNPTTNHWYYYKVDKNFDNIISVGSTPPPTTALRRRVVVWTMNVDKGTFITSADF